MVVTCDLVTLFCCRSHSMWSHKLEILVCRMPRASPERSIKALQEIGSHSLTQPLHRIHTHSDATTENIVHLHQGQESRRSALLVCSTLTPYGRQRRVSCIPCGEFKRDPVCLPTLSNAPRLSTCSMPRRIRGQICQKSVENGTGRATSRRSRVIVLGTPSKVPFNQPSIPSPL